MLKRCWYDGLVANTENGLRKKAVMADIDELYSKKLAARALTGLVQFREERRKRNTLDQLATQYYRDHAAVERKKLAFDALVSFAIYAKQSLNARTQHKFVLLDKSFTALQDYLASRRKRSQSDRLVQSFAKCTLASKVLKALSMNKVRGREYRE